MPFNSPVFLFLFLPTCLLVYYLAAQRYKNLVALFGSLFFYSWGQVGYLPLILGLILINYYLARRIEQQRAQAAVARRLLLVGILFNLLPLLFYKLISGYGAGWTAFFLPDSLVAQLAQAALPLGLSYLAFQLISYQVDIYNELVESEKSLLDFSLYVLLFPKIVIGPITRYRDMAQQLHDRTISAADVASGARRFILGLAKKVLIADTLARVVNPAFSLPSPNFEAGIAWFVLLGYALQLYFDFSGFTDMAIGLGQTLGFRLPENFNAPYLARSISDFWRRWHITLSGWFRDYVFYPLEFTRRRASRWRQALHVLIVFTLTGLWHGLTLNFMIWGLLHGLAIAVEMNGFGRTLKKLWAPLQHGYALLIILIGWVFFRSASLPFALAFLGRLAGWRDGITPLPFSATRPLPIIDPSVWLAFGLGILFCLPLLPWIQKRGEKISARGAGFAFAARVGVDLLLLTLLVGSVAFMVGYQYVASIYANF